MRAPVPNSRYLLEEGAPVRIYGGPGIPIERKKQMANTPKKPTSSEVLSQQPRRDTYGPDHGSGNPHLQPSCKESGIPTSLQNRRNKNACDKALAATSASATHAVPLPASTNGS